MTRGLKITLGVVAGVLALVGMCCVGTLLLGNWFSDVQPSSGRSADDEPRGTRGRPGMGFSFAPPASFVPAGEDGWKREASHGSERLSVDVARLPAMPGRAGVAPTFAALWNQLVPTAFDPLPAHDGHVPTPLLQRRFVSNGARAHFGRARLFRKGTQRAVYVSLYLVEEDDQLHPFLVVQGCQSTSPGGDVICDTTFGTTHRWVEELLEHVSGSPTAVPLVDDEDLVGHFTSGSDDVAQWINTTTGRTSATAVVRLMDFHFNADHSFTSKFTGGAGAVGALQVGTQTDEGTWTVQHDLLVLQGAQREERYFITGVPQTPNGRRLLLLQQKPNWSLAPGVEADVYAQVAD